jgi:hypothetical protein
VRGSHVGQIFSRTNSQISANNINPAVLSLKNFGHPNAFTTFGKGGAQQVQTDFDHQAIFSQYETYSWQAIKPASSLWDARMKSAVDAQLAAKDWTQVDSGGDVAIVAIKTTQTQRTLQTFYDGFGGGWGWRRFGTRGFGESETTEQDYKEGTLVVDMYDAKTKQLIWRGSAEDTLSSKGREK